MFLCASSIVIAAVATTVPSSAQDAGDGFVTTTRWKARQDDYLRFATAELDPAPSPTCIAHAERAAVTPSFDFDATAVTVDGFAAVVREDRQLRRHRPTSTSST